MFQRKHNATEVSLERSAKSFQQTRVSVWKKSDSVDSVL